MKIKNLQIRLFSFVVASCPNDFFCREAWGFLVENDSVLFYKMQKKDIYYQAIVIELYDGVVPHIQAIFFLKAVLVSSEKVVNYPRRLMLQIAIYQQQKGKNKNKEKKKKNIQEEEQEKEAFT